MYIAKITTGKTWSVSCCRKNAAGEPVPFLSTDTLRAQIRETPAGEKVADITATITSVSGATWTLSLTDEASALIPTKAQFGAVRVYWADVDVIGVDGTVKQLMQIKVFVTAGATKPEEVTP